MENEAIRAALTAIVGTFRSCRPRRAIRPAVLLGFLGLGLLGVSVAFAQLGKGAPAERVGDAGPKKKEESPRKSSEGFPLYARSPEPTDAPRPASPGTAGAAALPGEAAMVPAPVRTTAAPARPAGEAKPSPVLPDPARGPPSAA